MRGRVVVREEKARSSIIVDPGIADPRAIKNHVGIVIAIGPPVLLDSGVPVPHHFKPGDRVRFHFEATEKGRINKWEDGEDALYLAQREIDAVVE